MKTKLRMSLLVLLALFVAPAGAQDENFAIDVNINNFATSTAGDGPPSISRTDEFAAAVAEASGAEESECTSYGRQSAARSFAQGKRLPSGPNSVKLQFSVDGYAQGGHYRTCGGCVARKCVVVEGHDTSGATQAKSTALVTVKPSESLQSLQSLIRIRRPGTAEGVSISIQSSGATTRQMTAEEEVVYVEPFSPAVTILITAALNGSDKGGCCNTAQRIENFIDISAERAPVLSSAAAMAKGLSPFMINGEQTQGYRSVGSIGLRGEIHCTGTLVAPKTIITAAHCMFGLNSEIEQGALDFRIGDTFRSATLVFKIVKAELPDSQADGFVYDPNTYEDDLAVAYLDEVPPVDPTPLYEGSPPWKDIIASGKKVLMVGFGFNGITESNGHFSLFAPGIKRQAEIPIDNVTNRKIYFGANVQENTCRGDSGGPTLLEGTSPRGATLAIVAVTSGGSGVNCSDGINLRLDAYRSWLQTRLL